MALYQSRRLRCVMITVFKIREGVNMMAIYSDFKGLNSEVATFKCNSSVTEAGQLVKLVGSGMVGKCTAGDQRSELL